MQKQKIFYIVAFFSSFLVTSLIFRGNHDEKPIQKTIAVESVTKTPSPTGISQSQDREKIAAYLAKHRSPMAGTENALLTISSQYRIDYRLLLGIARKESSLGKRGCNHNPFGIASCRKGFNSYEEAYEYLAKLLTKSAYYDDWRKTGNVYDLIKVYCPESDGCNTQLYVSQLKQFMNEL